MSDNRFLGSGMKFPPQIDPATGRFALSSGAQSVKESVYLILMTHRGERWMQPGIGGELMGYAFMDTSSTMLSIMSSELRRLILEQEPRISSVDVRIDPGVAEGCLMVDIRYTLAESNPADNLVFPFYLTVDGEEELHGSQY
ncbi:MAG: GPW/gp25 family protein [Oscillospiraceae bacterium]|nr:GPW/gp25 family protein [Oscillospiraceae bacterium]